MLIFGEKLNSSIPKTLELYKNKDEKGLIDLIKSQESADYLDINCALCDNELEMLKYTCDLVKNNSNAKIMLDSSDPEVLKEAAKYVSGDFIINSVTSEERLNELIPVVKEYNCGVIALPLKDIVPEDPAERLENAKIILDAFKANEAPVDKIYFDVLIEPVATNCEAGNNVLETLKLFKNEGFLTTCGLSNVSFGLPKRKNINRYFMSLLMGCGLDSAICDSEDMIGVVKTCNMLQGKDDFCMDYIMMFKG